jgi:multicomponent Na+:H+ antiporter subunit E
MGHAFKLSMFLFAIWLLLSGHYTPVLLTLGILSSILVVYITTRANLIDSENHPELLKPSILLYWLWLGREVILSNIDVARRILDPRMPITPNVFKVRATQKTDLGRATYANSITLVPGTVTMNVDGNTFTVHALTHKTAAELECGEMNRRVCDVEKVF